MHHFGRAEFTVVAWPAKMTTMITQTSNKCTLVWLRVKAVQRAYIDIYPAASMFYPATTMQQYDEELK